MEECNEFPVGAAVLYRETDGEQVIDVKPVTVVSDTPERVVLWLPVGTETKRPRPFNHEPGTPRVWLEGSWRLEDSVWGWAESLILVQPESARATWVMWDPAGEFRGWYVNLQSPLRRTSLGFDFVDLQLDIVVAPDRSLRWKDADELDAAVQIGRLSPAQADAIRDEARRAVRDIEENAAPFSESWQHWRARSLSRPRLLPGWDDLSMYASD